MGNATSLIHHCITTPCCSGSKLLTLGAALVEGLVVEFVVAEVAAVFADTFVVGVVGLPVPEALVPTPPAPLTIDVFT